MSLIFSFVFLLIIPKLFNINLCPGTSKKAALAHTLVKSHLEAFLNQHSSSILLVQVLNETYEPLGSISKLPTSPHFGVISTVRITGWKLKDILLVALCTTI